MRLISGAFALYLCFVFNRAANLVEASAFGAAGCMRTAFGSVEMEHLSLPRTFGALSDYGFEVTIAPTGGGSAETLDAASPHSILTGTDYTLTLSLSDSGKFYRGVLFRLEGPEGETEGETMDTSAALEVVDDTTTQIATVCTSDQVGGVTHVNNLDKTTSSATLTADVAANGYILGVTAVIQNRNNLSEWYFTEFILNASEPPPTTSSPTAMPTKTPSAAPTETTTAPPTSKPTAAPASAAPAHSTAGWYQYAAALVAPLLVFFAAP